MVSIQDVQKIERKLGTASIIKAKDFVPAYSEGVSRFLRDNASLGENWQTSVADILYNGFKGIDNKGNITGSNIPIGIAISSFLPDVSLITGEQLLRLYKNAGNKNPFGNVYIDFGVLVNGKPERNTAQAKALLESMNKNALKTEIGIFTNFSQLRLIADQEAGLVYRLADGIKQEELASVSAYPFDFRIGKNGLFRVFLSWDGNGCAYGDDIVYSDDDGRVVCYDAEGIVSKKSPKDLASTLQDKFVRRF